MKVYMIRDIKGYYFTGTEGIRFWDAQEYGRIWTDKFEAYYKCKNLKQSWIDSAQIEVIEFDLKEIENGTG